MQKLSTIYDAMHTYLCTSLAPCLLDSKIKAFFGKVTKKVLVFPKRFCRSNLLLPILISPLLFFFSVNPRIPRANSSSQRGWDHPVYSSWKQKWPHRPSGGTPCQCPSSSRGLESPVRGDLSQNPRKRRQSLFWPNEGNSGAENGLRWQ